MRISDGSSDVCSSDLYGRRGEAADQRLAQDRRHPRIDTVQRDVIELPIVGRPLRGKRRKVGLLEAYVAQASTVREFTRMRDVLRIEIDADECAVRIERCQQRSEEHTSELQSLMRISYAVFCLKKKKHQL